MRCLAITLALTFCACSGTGSNTVVPNPVAEAPLNPVSAPSAKLKKEKGEESSVTPEAPTPATPKKSVAGPRKAVFVDVKFSIILPSPDWKVDMTPQGVMLSYEKGQALLFIVVNEDMRPLLKVANSDREHMKKNPTFTVGEPRSEKNPERIIFNAQGKLPDGRTIDTESVFLRNPGNPTKQTIGFMGFWPEGQTASKAQILSIIASLSAIP